MQTVNDHDEELKPAPAWVSLGAGVTRRLPAGKYRLIEWLCRGSNRRFVGKMAKELGGYSFDCCLRDRVARSVFLAGCHATQEISFVRAVLRSGMTFVDVGANWGLFTLVAAHLVGEPGRVLALEPDPRIFIKLKSNVERNHLGQVRVFEAAAADRDAYLMLAGHDHGGENWEVSRLVENASIAQTMFRVRSRRLDGLLDEDRVKDVDLLKIDVEGAEDMVLNGMEAGLKSHRYRRILLELHPPQLAERGRGTDEVLDVLKANGYQGYALDYTLPAMRKTYYKPWLDSCEFIIPLEHGLANRLRHTLWLAPDQRDLTKT